LLWTTGTRSPRAYSITGWWAHCSSTPNPDEYFSCCW